MLLRWRGSSADALILPFPSPPRPRRRDGKDRTPSTARRSRRSLTSRSTSITSPTRSRLRTTSSRFRAAASPPSKVLTSQRPLAPSSSSAMRSSASGTRYTTLARTLWASQRPSKHVCALVGFSPSSSLPTVPSRTPQPQSVQRSLSPSLSHPPFHPFVKFALFANEIHHDDYLGSSFSTVGQPRPSLLATTMRCDVR